MFPLLAVAAVAFYLWTSSNEGPSMPAPQNSEARWSEARKLASLHPELRPKVERILASLRREGFPAKLFFGWRSLETQARLAARGTGLRSGSKHVNQVDGKPASRAADIVHATEGWSNEQFFGRLGMLAEREGLTWGGRWVALRDPAHVELP